MKPESRGQLVRGFVHVHSRFSLSNIEAHTHWFRHDDDLSALEHDLQSLVNVYRSFSQTESITFGYEYKDYKK